MALLLVEEGGREREPVRASRAHQLSTLGGKGGIFSNLAMMSVFIDNCVFVFFDTTRNHLLYTSILIRIIMASIFAPELV